MTIKFEKIVKEILEKNEADFFFKWRKKLIKMVEKFQLNNKKVLGYKYNCCAKNSNWHQKYDKNGGNTQMQKEEKEKMAKNNLKKKWR